MFHVKRCFYANLVQEKEFRSGAGGNRSEIVAELPSARAKRIDHQIGSLIPAVTIVHSDKEDERPSPELFCHDSPEHRAVPSSKIND